MSVRTPIGNDRPRRQCRRDVGKLSGDQPGAWRPPLHMSGEVFVRGKSRTALTAQLRCPFSRPAMAAPRRLRTEWAVWALSAICPFETLPVGQALDLDRLARRGFKFPLALLPMFCKCSLEQRAQAGGRTWCRAYPRWLSRASRPGRSTSRCISPAARRLHHRRPRRQGGGRIARAGAFGADRLGPCPSRQAHHRQPRARRPAEGGQPLRPADRARRHGGDRRRSHRRARRLRGDRRAGARRDDQRRRRRAAGGDRRQRARQRPDLPGGLRPGGGVGVGRARDSRAALADPARQPLQGHASLVPPRAGARSIGRAAAGPARHQGPGERQARARSRRGRRPQPPDERPARRGKIDARRSACPRSCRRSRRANCSKCR